MKIGDFVWAFVLVLLSMILVFPQTRELFIAFTDAHKYVSGFIKFAVLATMGDMLGIRIRLGDWKWPLGVWYKAFIWGLIGMMITLAFPVCIAGSDFAQTNHLLPFKGFVFAKAFFASAMMNLTFGPMMMTFHRFTDMYIDLFCSGRKATLHELIGENNWYSLVEFTWLKACPFFWIPAHTAVFLLPGEYRVVASAFLSIALGVLLALSNKISLTQANA